MPGDVVNDMGDIATSSDGVMVDGSIHYGNVMVTRHQAALARPFGWRKVREHRGLVEIERGHRGAP